MEPVLQVRNIEKSFKNSNVSVKVLQKISFSIMAGECVGLVGQSGCGKSTLAKIIAGINKANAGEIIICGKNSQDVYKEKKIYMQMIFQQSQASFNPRQTLGWSITEGLRNSGWSKEKVKKRLMELLQQVGLPVTISKAYPHEVSGGQCQRAAIARAIALSPRLLLCDEITSALDVTTQAQIITLLKNICRDNKIACLFISHDLAVVQMICQQIIVMHDGNIVETGMTDAVIKQPQSIWTKKILMVDLT